MWRRCDCEYVWKCFLLWKVCKVLILWTWPFKVKNWELLLDFAELISQRKLAKAYWKKFSLSKPKIEHSGLRYQHGIAHPLITWRFPKDSIMPGSRRPFLSSLLINIDCAHRITVASWVIIWRETLSLSPNGVQDEI